MNHARFVPVLAWISGLLALASLVVAVLHRAHIHELSEPARYIITGFWVIMPPIWFWTEWAWISARIDADERDRIKHPHDLARNIWLALVAILVGLLEITVFK
jgi:hypothetical protein